MLVSIIIPSYNRSALLSEAIQSCIIQTYRPIECIIVDDGSTDDTKVVVEKFIEEKVDQFVIKYIYQQNAGSQSARNMGTLTASGKFIQYLDSDDLLYSDKLLKQVRYLNENPQCDGVFGDWHEGTVTRSEFVRGFKSNDFIAQILTQRCIANFSFLLRDSIVNKTGDWDVKIKRNQEIDFHLRAILEGANFEYIPCNCGLWRTHYNQRIVNSTGLKEILESYKKWETLLKDKNLFDNTLQRKIANFYMWLLTQYESSSKKELISLLKEIVRLDPQIDFYRSKKFVMLRKFIGKNHAFKIWIKRYYKIGDGQKSKATKVFSKFV